MNNNRTYEQKINGVSMITMNVTLSEQAVQYRKRLNLNQLATAEVCGVSRTTISNVENGKASQVITSGVVAILKEKYELEVLGMDK